jgi:predicted MFS family arabinose efflux permease
MKKTFSRYEIFLIAILTIIQFTIILDFMVLSPLSAILLPELKITTSQFGMVVSAYAWSAGLSGLLSAGFADKYDRKKLLLFFYAGFVIGTLLCGIASTYYFLLGARIITGIFGGVIGSIVYAIAADTFAMEVRGRVMGFLQMAFAGAQVLGLPIGLYLANKTGWHSPFLMIVAVSIVVGIVIIRFVKPVASHIAANGERKVVEHFVTTLSNRTYLKAFAATVLLATGGFMLMPFGSAFAVNNVGLSLNDLPLLYMITGICSMMAAPLIGKLSDTHGKYLVFSVGSAAMIGIVMYYCNLGITPLWIVITLSVFMFVGVSCRMVTASALLTAVPSPGDRGAFMSINSSVQMVSGGVASLVAGMIVYQTDTGFLENYDILGYVVASTTAITIFMMYFINRMVKAKLAQAKQNVPAAA